MFQTPLEQTPYRVVHLVEHKIKENNMHYFRGMGLFIRKVTTSESYTKRTLRTADKRGFKKPLTKITLYCVGKTLSLSLWD